MLTYQPPRGRHPVYSQILDTFCIQWPPLQYSRKPTIEWNQTLRVGNGLLGESKRITFSVWSDLKVSFFCCKFSLHSFSKFRLGVGLLRAAEMVLQSEIICADILRPIWLHTPWRVRALTNLFHWCQTFNLCTEFHLRHPFYRDDPVGRQAGQGHPLQANQALSSCGKESGWWYRRNWTSVKCKKSVSTHSNRPVPSYAPCSRAHLILTAHAHAHITFTRTHTNLNQRYCTKALRKWYYLSYYILAWKYCPMKFQSITFPLWF